MLWVKQFRRLVWTVGREFRGFHPRLITARIILAPFPYFVGNRLRGMVLRMLGFNVGRGTLFSGMLSITGTGNVASRIKIGEDCFFNVDCAFDAENSITVGHRVSFGHRVLVLTSSHETGSKARRAGEVTTAPVVIEDGAWIGSGAIILPGVTLGAGSIVGAGSVVTRDIPPNSLAVGQPARVVRALDGEAKGG